MNDSSYLITPAEAYLYLTPAWINTVLSRSVYPVTEVVVEVAEGQEQLDGFGFNSCPKTMVTSQLCETATK